MVLQLLGSWLTRVRCHLYDLELGLVFDAHLLVLLLLFCWGYQALPIAASTSRDA